MDTTVLNSDKGVNNQNSKKNKKENIVAAGFTGALAGAGAAVVIGTLTNEANAAELPEAEENVIATENEETPKETPVWAVGDIEVANTVNDDMSFSEAFAAAREEVGPGGAFQWHGSVYGTYTAGEWNEMSVGERAEFNDNFSWNHVDATSGNVATVQPIEVHHHHHHYADAPIEVEEVVYETVSETKIEIVDAHPNVMEAEPEIEVLGVVHDYQTGANIGGMTIDGQDIFVVDVDGDLEFDVAMSDINHNNVVDEGEVVDIHGQGLTVDDLGGFSNPADSYSASDDYMVNNDDSPIFEV